MVEHFGIVSCFSSLFLNVVSVFSFSSTAKESVREELALACGLVFV